MSNDILGLRHITAISNNAKKNFDFYTNVLGLRLVKKTVNFNELALRWSSPPAMLARL